MPKAQPKRDPAVQRLIDDMPAASWEDAREVRAWEEPPVNDAPARAFRFRNSDRQTQLAAAVLQAGRAEVDVAEQKEIVAMKKDTPRLDEAGGRASRRAQGDVDECEDIIRALN